MKMKEELRYVVMEFGGLFIMEDIGMFVMLQLFANNWDIRDTQVCIQAENHTNACSSSC